MQQSKTNIHTLAVIHGLYFCVTGIWPLVHMDSFLLVTGPKTELWLVEAVGVLVLVMGLGFLTAGFQKHIPFPIGVIAITSALGLILIDVLNVWAGIISPIYLLDALAEFILLVAWIFYTFKTKLWRAV